MVFSSTIFLYGFFPVFFVSLYLMRSNVRLQNVWIIVASILFYAWGATEFFLIVLCTLLIDYFLGIFIYTKSKFAKLFVFLDVIMNIGILVYFKYLNFFMENINIVFKLMNWNPVVFTSIILPLGISFVVFQKMTYCLDIAKGTCEPTHNFFHLLEYLLIFPQIVAGPIVKYNELSQQIRKREMNRECFLQGFSRFGVGLFKKVWIADIVAATADTVFNAQAIGPIPFDYAWIGIVAYTFQIYFDFSAYSDMAIGMLAMMGFHIQENFKKPYCALSISDFWKRWHISMTSWFREYLYFPLGGNRKGKLRTYVNQWFVFLVSGFWHGAAWNFIFWGGYHGTLLCAERAFLLQKSKKIKPVFRWACTFFLVMIGWVFFRANDLQTAFAYIASMFDFSSYYTHVSPAHILSLDGLNIFILCVLAPLISFLPMWSRGRMWLEKNLSGRLKSLYPWLALFLFVISALKIITGSISPFIYFRF